MVMFEVQNGSPPPPWNTFPTPSPPYNSNQQPIGPGRPWEMLQGVQQQIETWIPHETPAVDNYQGIPMHIKTWIPTNLPSGVYPGSYGFIVENPNPRKVKELTSQVHWPSGVKELQGEKESYGLDAGSFVGGAIVGFIAGALILTATGKNLTRATANRVTSYIQPKQ
jgi:hypothetical protein